MKRRTFAIVALAAIILGGIFINRWLQAANPGQTESSLTLYGNVDIRQVDLSFRVPGRIMAVHFEEGDRLRPGDLVSELDPEPYLQEVAFQRAELAKADAELDKLRNGYRKEEIKAARARLSEHKAALRKLEIEYQRRKSLVDGGSISRQSFDDIDGARDEAQARMQSSTEDLALLVRGYRSEDIKKAEAERESAAARLEQALTRLSDTMLICPTDGTVLTRTREPGSIVAEGTNVITVSKLAPVWVRAYVPENQLGSISPGARVFVYTDSVPGKALEGQIGFISSEAEFTPKNVETPELRTQLVYRFRVVVSDERASILRQGMPVTVKVNASPNHSQTAVR